MNQCLCLGYARGPVIGKYFHELDLVFLRQTKQKNNLFNFVLSFFESAIKLVTLTNKKKERERINKNNQNIIKSF